MSIDLSRSVREAPPDWPGPGTIDLAIHDLPHDSSTIEWWYVNAHLTLVDGRRRSMFAAFFRVDVSDQHATDRTHAHFLSWAVVDLDARTFSPHTLIDPRSARLALDDLDRGHGPADPRLTRAMREMLERNRVALPDRVLATDAGVPLDRLALDYDGNTFAKRADGSYEVSLLDAAGAVGCRLRFALKKPIVRHGDDGVVRGVGAEDMFYYFSPSADVTGAMLVDGRWVDVAQGDGWYDHEFGEGAAGSQTAERKVAWNWLAAQLDNGYEISAYDLFDKADAAKSYGRWLIVIDPTGERRAYRDFTLIPLDTWASTKTFNEYPTRYRLEAPRAGIYLDVEAAFPGQEVMTIIAAPAFWEGVVSVDGAFHNLPVTGRGFVERSGVSVVDTTDEFFASVGRETRRAIEALLPERPTREQALRLISGPGREHFLDGIDLDQYSRTVLQPIRAIILRGGKAWRSYGILSCMDLVGGDSQRFAHWLALPELLHVGSLIIDDVQDASDVRRGGPACHKLYGDALAINAGCASYFLAEIPARASGLDFALRTRIYESFFEAVRAAHAGQALDIDTLHRLMPDVVESGDGALLERRVLAIHRLKSAAPAGALARMAALVGGGTDAQSEGLGNLFEAFGVAFQIIDDVLNLRGFEENRKSRGEDITAAKITAPIAKAMSRLTRQERHELWTIVSGKPTDRKLIGDAVAMIDGCGALQACEDHARDLVESAWRTIDPIVPDTQFKIRLRAFGWFVLDRHY